MFIEALIIGIIIGLIKHGKVYRLSYVDFSMSLIIYISALFYVSIVIMNLGLLDFNTILYTAFLLISYALSCIFLLANISKKFMFVPLIGLCSNLVCFIANGFRFPISSAAVLKFYGNEMLGLLNSGKIRFFIPAENAALPFLGNIIPINKLISVSIVSAGDIIIAVGIVLIVLSIMSDKHIQNRNRITFAKNIFR